MEKEFDIEITTEENNNEAGNVQLPLNFLSFGEIEPDDVKVYIKQDVYKALEKYASSDTSKELGTILIGDYCEQLGKAHVVISDYIEAKYTDASASTLTFTHETWDYVHKQHDMLYPSKKIIGWQHTHPNYGIFLSNYDLFIQDNFFNMPFQVAYVIDPIQNIRGFFQWKNGKTEKLKGYYVYDEVGKPIKIEQKKVDAPQSTKAAPSKVMTILVSILCVLTVVLGIFAINMNNKYYEMHTEVLSLCAEQGLRILPGKRAAFEILKDVADFCNAECVLLTLGCSRHILAIDEDASAGGREYAGDHVQQRRLATAGCTQQDVGLAILKGQVAIGYV